LAFAEAKLHRHDFSEEMAMTTVSYRKLRDVIIAGTAKRRDRGSIEAAAWDILRSMGDGQQPRLAPDASAVTQFNRCAKNDFNQARVSHKKISSLFELFRSYEIGHFSSEKELRRAIVQIDFDDVDFYKGKSDNREIEILTRSGFNLITEEDHHPVNLYVDVRVDEVQFYQNQREADPAPIPGRYIRISPPVNGQGAVVLPVDIETGQVLLVTQFRHPQREWLHEIPRGFSDPGESELETGMRELAEEAAAKPLVFRNLNDEEAVSFIKLRSLFTDTGKLTEAPAYFLALVRRLEMEEGLKRTQPLMENPLWVSLPAFYEAVYSGEANVEQGECQRVEGYAEEFPVATAIDWEEPRLEIRDAFTVTAALLAAPLLEMRFPSQWSEVHRRREKWVRDIDEYATTG
jgi:8-oxo-dGTP pyrophosphatase MutT (NUDIX family)